MSRRRSKSDFGWDSHGVVIHSGPERKIGFRFRRAADIYARLSRCCAEVQREKHVIKWPGVIKTYSIRPVNPDEEVVIGKRAKAFGSPQPYHITLRSGIFPRRLICEQDRVVVLEKLWSAVFASLSVVVAYLVEENADALCSSRSATGFILGFFDGR